jgi:hypothetical protein
MCGAESFVNRLKVQAGRFSFHSLARSALGSPIVKHPLRKGTAKTVETVCAAISEILKSFTPEECANYFRNSGYST